MSGFTLAGSPPARAIAERIAARSTIAGTPVRSCIRTRVGMKARFASGAGAGQAARARTSFSETSREPARRMRFSSRILTVWGRLPTSPSAASRESSTGPPDVSRRACAFTRSCSQTTVERSETQMRRLVLLFLAAILASGRALLLAAVVLDGPAVLEPRPTSDLRLASATVLQAGLGHERWHRPGLALLVQRHEHQVGARRVLALAARHGLDLDAHAYLERGGTDIVHAGPNRHEVAHVYRVQERHLVDRDRHAHPARVLDRGDACGRVHELHPLAPVDDPRDVRVRDLHQLDERGLGVRDDLGLDHDRTMLDLPGLGGSRRRVA